MVSKPIKPGGGRGAIDFYVLYLTFFTTKHRYYKPVEKIRLKTVKDQRMKNVAFLIVNSVFKKVFIETDRSIISPWR
jgi:hypothetical protein